MPRHPWGRLPLLLAVLVKAIGSLLTSAAEPSAVYEAGRGRAGLRPRCHGAGVTAWQARMAWLLPSDTSGWNLLNHAMRIDPTKERLLFTVDVAQLHGVHMLRV